MPTISLRLTEQEHADLTSWAHDGHRSLQKQIIWMLFSGEHEVEDIRMDIAVKKTKERAQVIKAADSAFAAAHDLPDPHSKGRTADQEWLMRRAGKRK